MSIGIISEDTKMQYDLVSAISKKDQFEIMIVRNDGMFEHW